MIIQVPAAYSQRAHNLKFDEAFTQVLRRLDSWKDSNSFAWFKEYSGESLLIACKEDKIIPREVIDTYKAIGEEKENFSFIDIEDALHNIWKAVEDKERIVGEAYSAIKKFLS